MACVPPVNVPDPIDDVILSVEKSSSGQANGPEPIERHVNRYHRWNATAIVDTWRSGAPLTRGGSARNSATAATAASANVPTPPA